MLFAAIIPVVHNEYALIEADSLDFQNYAVGDLFTEFMNTEPVGVITTEQDPMYAGMKSLWKTNQSGYMKYYRFRDIKLTGCTIQYSETFRLNEVSSSYAYFTWSGMAADTEAYPNIQLKVVSGRFVVYIRQNSISDPIAILDCGPRDTFVHKVTVSWSSSMIVVQFDDLYQEVPVPDSFTYWPVNTSRFNLTSNVYLHRHSFTLYGREVAQ